MRFILFAFLGALLGCAAASGPATRTRSRLHEVVVDCDFERASLEEVAEFLWRSTGVKILIGDRVAHVEVEPELTMKLMRARADEVLTRVCKSLGKTYVVTDEGIILIIVE